MSGSDARYKWLLAALLFCVAAVNYADRTAISSVFPLLRAELGMSDVALAGVGSVFLWSYGLCSPAAGFLSARLRHSRMILASLAAWSLVMCVSGLVRNSTELLVARAVLGAAECCYIPAAVALLSAFHERESRATALAIHSAGLSFGLVAGGTLAGFLGERIGWRLGFFVLGGAGLVLAAFARRVLRDPEGSAASREPASAESPARALHRLACTPTYLLMLLEGVLIAVGNWIFFNWLPLYYWESYHVSMAKAGFLGASTLQVSTVAGLLAGGWLSDRVAKKRPMRRLWLLTAVNLAAAPFLLVFLSRPSIALLTLAIVGFALLRAVATANQLPVLCEVLPGRLRSTAVGFLNTTNTLTGGIGVMAAGYLKSDYGLGGVFAGVSVLAASASGAAALALLTFERDRHRNTLEPAEAAVSG